MYIHKALGGGRYDMGRQIICKQILCRRTKYSLYLGSIVNKYK